MMDRTDCLEALMICLLATVTGCGDGGDAPADKPTADSAAAATDGSETPDATPTEGGPDTSWENSESSEKEAPKAIEVSLETVDKAGYEKALAAHKGKVILVDFWGTWCGPCREGFPHTVEIAEKFKDEGLQVIALAIEYDEDLGPVGAKKFLSKVGAAATQNLISSSTDIDESFEFFGITGEALPEYHLFDRAGKRIKVFASDEEDGEKPAWTHKDVEAAVKEAIGG